MLRTVSQNALKVINNRAVGTSQQLPDVFKVWGTLTRQTNTSSAGKILRAKSLRFNDGKKEGNVTYYGWIMLTIPITTFGLGCWQVERKKWKERLIDELHFQTNSAPVDLVDLIENFSELDSMEYKPVRVRGEFLHDRELVMGPRSLITSKDEHKGGLMTQKDTSIGYLIITPFQIENTNNIILINRGWVPKNCIDPNRRLEGQIKGVTEVVGLIRKSENRPQFTPKRSGEIFMYRDLPQMCKMTGADPVFLDAKSSINGGPIGNQTRVTLRNEHASYIATWFSLSALTSFLWYQQIFKRMKR